MPVGGRTGIRTQGPFKAGGFQDRCDKPGSATLPVLATREDGSSPIGAIPLPARHHLASPGGCPANIPPIPNSAAPVTAFSVANAGDRGHVDTDATTS